MAFATQRGSLEYHNDVRQRYTHRCTEYGAKAPEVKRPVTMCRKLATRITRRMAKDSRMNQPAGPCTFSSTCAKKEPGMLAARTHVQRTSISHDPLESPRAPCDVFINSQKFILTLILFHRRVIRLPSLPALAAVLYCRATGQAAMLTTMSSSRRSIFGVTLDGYLARNWRDT
jgi:hypothetical protein